MTKGLISIAGLASVAAIGQVTTITNADGMAIATEDNQLAFPILISAEDRLNMIVGADLAFDQVPFTVATQGDYVYDMFKASEGTIDTCSEKSHYFPSGYTPASAPTATLDTRTDFSKQALSLNASMTAITKQASTYKCLYPVFEAQNVSIDTWAMGYQEVDDVTSRPMKFAAMPSEATNYETHSKIGLARAKTGDPALEMELNFISQISAAQNISEKTFSLMYSPGFAGNQTMGVDYAPPKPDSDTRSDDQWKEDVKNSSALMGDRKLIFFDLGKPNTNQSSATDAITFDLASDNSNWLSAEGVSDVKTNSHTMTQSTEYPANFGSAVEGLGIPSSIVAAFKTAFPEVKVDDTTSFNCSEVDMSKAETMTISFSNPSSSTSVTQRQITIVPHTQFVQIDEDEGMCKWAFSTSSSDVWEIGRSVLTQYYTSYKYDSNQVEMSLLKNGTMPFPQRITFGPIDPHPDDNDTLIVCPAGPPYEIMTEDERDNFIRGSSWSSITVYTRQDIFGRYDLTDGKHHWENGVIGEACFSLLKLLGSRHTAFVMTILGPIGMIVELMPFLNDMAAPPA